MSVNCYSAPPSKLRAKVLLACIWIMAAVLATPMAIALSVTYVEEQDSGKSNLVPLSWLQLYSYKYSSYS